MSSTICGKGAIFLHAVAVVGGAIKVAKIIDPWCNAVGLIEEL